MTSIRYLSWGVVLPIHGNRTRRTLTLAVLCSVGLFLAFPAPAQDLPEINDVIFTFDISGSLATAYVKKEAHDRALGYVVALARTGWNDSLLKAPDTIDVKPLDASLSKPLVTAGARWAVCWFGNNVRQMRQLQSGPLTERDLIETYYPRAFPDQTTAIPDIVDTVCKQASLANGSALMRGLLWVYVSDDVPDYYGSDERLTALASQYTWQPIFAIRVKGGGIAYSPGGPGGPSQFLVQVRRVIDRFIVKDGSPPPPPGEIEALRTRIAGLEREIAALKQPVPPRQSPEEMALSSDIEAELAKVAGATTKAADMLTAGGPALQGLGGLVEERKGFAVRLADIQNRQKALAEPSPLVITQLVLLQAELVYLDCLLKDLKTAWDAVSKEFRGQIRAVRDTVGALTERARGILKTVQQGGEAKKEVEGLVDERAAERAKADLLLADADSKKLNTDEVKNDLDALNGDFAKLDGIIAEIQKTNPEIKKLTQRVEETRGKVSRLAARAKRVLESLSARGSAGGGKGAKFALDEELKGINDDLRSVKAEFEALQGEAKEKSLDSGVVADGIASIAEEIDGAEQTVAEITRIKPLLERLATAIEQAAALKEEGDSTFQALSHDPDRKAVKAGEASQRKILEGLKKLRSETADLDKLAKKTDPKYVAITEGFAALQGRIDEIDRVRSDIRKLLPSAWRPVLEILLGLVVAGGVLIIIVLLISSCMSPMSIALSAREGGLGGAGKEPQEFVLRPNEGIALFSGTEVPPEAAGRLYDVGAKGYCLKRRWWPAIELVGPSSLRITKVHFNQQFEVMKPDSSSVRLIVSRTGKPGAPSGPGKVKLAGLAVMAESAAPVSRPEPQAKADSGRRSL